MRTFRHIDFTSLLVHYSRVLPYCRVPAGREHPSGSGAGTRRRGARRVPARRHVASAGRAFAARAGRGLAAELPRASGLAALLRESRVDPLLQRQGLNLSSNFNMATHAQ